MTAEKDNRLQEEKKELDKAEQRRKAREGEEGYR
jgi:hypothetical protein